MPIEAAVPEGSTQIAQLPTPPSEEVFLVGSAGGLVSILTRPATARAAAASEDAPPAVLFLNAGVIHRVGPHRLHVTLARRVASLGFAALRLDLSGIGDSRPLSGDLPFRQRAVADARATMDELTAATGARRFVIFGLCSGADNAVATALADDRVVGIALVDSYTYGTLRSAARKLVATVRRHASDGPRGVVAWGARAASRRLRSGLSAVRRRAGGERDEGDEAQEQNGRETPTRDAFGAQLAALHQRGVKILAMYSGALGDRYNHPDHVFDVFPHLRGKIDHAYFPDVNHTFTELDAQRRIITTVTDWVGKNFR